MLLCASSMNETGCVVAGRLMMPVEVTHDRDAPERSGSIGLFKVWTLIIVYKPNY